MTVKTYFSCIFYIVFIFIGEKKRNIKYMITVCCEAFYVFHNKRSVELKSVDANTFSRFLLFAYQESRARATDDHKRTRNIHTYRVFFFHFGDHRLYRVRQLYLDYAFIRANRLIFNEQVHFHSFITYDCIEKNAFSRIIFLYAKFYNYSRDTRFYFSCC